MFEVLIKFADLEDNSLVYEPGDLYPREGLKPTKKRIKELSSKDNKRNIQLIRLVKEVKEPLNNPKMENNGEVENTGATPSDPSNVEEVEE